MALDTDNHNSSGGGSASNVYDRHHHHAILNHHQTPQPDLTTHWSNEILAQDQPSESWTTFGVQTENRARAASNPNPNSRRPSLRLHINNHFPPQQHYQRHQPLPMSVIPAPMPPPRPDLNPLNHANPALLAKQSHHYFSTLQNDRRLPLPHVPAATSHRLPDLHAQNNSRSPSPRNAAITTTPSTTTTSSFTPSPFSGSQTKGMNTANTGSSTPSTGSASAKRNGGFQLPFSTPSGSSSSPNLNSTLSVVEENHPSPQPPGSTAAGGGAGRRPLPVPPPPSRPASRNANPSAPVAIHTPVGPRVNSPLRSAPARGNERGPGHARSSSDVENGSESLFYTSRKGKGREMDITNSQESEPPDPETLPYHERSEKWKGKQKMRDLPPSPTSPKPSTSPKERTSPVFMSSAFPATTNTNLQPATTTVRRSPAHSPSLPSLNTTYSQHQEVNVNPIHLSTAGLPTTINTSSAIPPDTLSVDLPPSLTYKSPISAKSTVASGGISKRAGIRRSGSVSSIRSNSSWRSSKSGHSVSGWAGKVFGGGSTKQESQSANSSPVVPGPAFATPTNTSLNGIFNYDNNYATYTPSSNTSNTSTPRQPPTPRLLIPTTPSFVPPPPPLPTHTQPLPTISSPVAPNARSPLPPVPPVAAQPAAANVITPMAGAISRRGTKHRANYFVANRSSMESISSLAVREQPPPVPSKTTNNGSVDSLGSSGSGSSGGSVATVDAISLDRDRGPYMFYEGTGSHGTSQDSLSMSSGLRTPSSVTHTLPSLMEDDIGHAHAGYDVDDERVYIDDGYDDPSDSGHGDLDTYLEDIGGDVDLDDLGEFEAVPGKEWDEFETRWSGLVIGDGKDDSPLSPMIYARDEEEDSDPEDLGGAVSNSSSASPSANQTPKGKGMKGKATAVTAVSTPIADGAAVDGFVYIAGGSGAGSGGGSGRGMSQPTTTTVSAPSRKSSFGASAQQPQPPLQVVVPGEVLDDPSDILGGEMEMVFASHTSPTRRERGQSYVLGLGGLDDYDSDDEEKEFVRGKWRKRKQSPEFGTAKIVRSTSVGPLRRYQSEELMIPGSGINEDKRGAQTIPVRSGDAPLRLTPNRYVEPEGLAPPESSHRSRSHQGHASISIPPQNVNHNPNKPPLPSHVLNYDYAVTSGAGAFVGIGGLPGPFPFLATQHLEDPRIQMEDESHSIRSTRSRKSKSGNSTRREPSRDQPKEPGREHVRKQLDSLAPKVSYDVWVNKGVSAPSPPEKKKGVLTKAPS